MTILTDADVICRKCNLPHALDANGLCSFCRPRANDKFEADRYEFPIVGFAVIFIVAVLVACFFWLIANYTEGRNKLSKTEVKRAAISATTQPPVSLVPESVLQLPNSH